MPRETASPVVSVPYETASTGVPRLELRFAEGDGIDTRYVDHEEAQSSRPGSKSVRSPNASSPMSRSVSLQQHANSGSGGGSTIPLTHTVRSRIQVTATHTAPGIVLSGFEDGAVSVTFLRNYSSSSSSSSGHTRLFSPKEMRLRMIMSDPPTGDPAAAKTATRNGLPSDPVVSLHCVALTESHILLAVGYKDAVYVHVVPTRCAESCHNTSIGLRRHSDMHFASEVNEMQLKSYAASVQPPDELLLSPQQQQQQQQQQQRRGSRRNSRLQAAQQAPTTQQVTVCSATLSPCCKFLAISLTYISSSVLVFALPDFASAVVAAGRPTSRSRATLDSSCGMLASSHLMAPRFFAYCIYPAPQHRFNSMASPAEEAAVPKGRAAASREPTPVPVVVPQPVAMCYFLTNYTEARVRALHTESAAMPYCHSISLLVVWEGSVCYARVPLRETVGSYATRLRALRETRRPTVAVATSPKPKRRSRPSSGVRKEKEPLSARRKTTNRARSIDEGAAPVVEAPVCCAQVFYSPFVVEMATVTPDSRFVVFGCEGGAVMLLDQHRCLSVASALSPPSTQTQPPPPPSPQQQYQAQHLGLQLQANITALAAYTEYSEENSDDATKSVKASVGVRHGDLSYSVAHIRFPLQAASSAEQSQAQQHQPQQRFLTALPNSVTALAMLPSLGFTLVFMEVPTPMANLHGGTPTPSTAFLWDTSYHCVLGTLPLVASSSGLHNSAAVCCGAAPSECLTWVQPLQTRLACTITMGIEPTMVPRCCEPSDLIRALYPQWSLVLPDLNMTASARLVKSLSPSKRRDHDALQQCIDAAATSVLPPVGGRPHSASWFTASPPRLSSAPRRRGGGGRRRPASPSCTVLSNPPTISQSEAALFPTLWLSALEASSEALRFDHLNHIMATLK